MNRNDGYSAGNHVQSLASFTDYKFIVAVISSGYGGNSAGADNATVLYKKDYSQNSCATTVLILTDIKSNSQVRGQSGAGLMIYVVGIK